MTEEEAHAWIADRFGISAVGRLSSLVELVLEESQCQNLVAASTMPMIWSRHVVDSAQLVPIASEVRGCWLDIGSGAGFPGLVVAILRDEPVILAEPRKRRAEFLSEAVKTLNLGSKVRIVPSYARLVESAEPMAVVSARAVGSMQMIVSEARHLTTPSTMWLLHRGRSAADEHRALPVEWQQMFHVERSVSDPESFLLLGRGSAVL